MKKIISIVIVIFALLAVGGGFLLKGKPRSAVPEDGASCQAMYDSIEADLEKANYCSLDSDCDSILLGGQYIKFGCYHYINKAVDKNGFYKKMNAYNQECSKMINDCAPVPEAVCENKICVSNKSK